MAGHWEQHHGLESGGVQRLVDLLGSVGPAADLALRLALSRWWAHEDLDANAAGFRAAGLRIMD